jgi:hypothetical protein
MHRLAPTASETLQKAIDEVLAEPDVAARKDVPDRIQIHEEAHGLEPATTAIAVTLVNVGGRAMERAFDEIIWPRVKQRLGRSGASRGGAGAGPDDPAQPGSTSPDRAGGHDVLLSRDAATALERGDARRFVKLLATTFRDFSTVGRKMQPVPGYPGWQIVPISREHYSLFRWLTSQESAARNGARVLVAAIASANELGLGVPPEGGQVTEQLSNMDEHTRKELDRFLAEVLSGAELDRFLDEVVGA